jgi:putative heme-binding domain-containing protein
MLARILAAPALVLLAVSPSLAVERWADPALPVTDGLVFWLDASRQGPARKAHDLPPLTSGAIAGIAFDASGNGLHAVQRFRDAQPRYISSGGHAVFRFDGVRQHFQATNVRRKLTDFTVFLVAAAHSNPGSFRAFFAGNEAGKRDYTTGFTIDQDAPGSPHFDRINIEGKGFGGAVNLLDRALAFREFHTLEVVSRAGAGGVQLLIGGKPAGRRDRQAGTLTLDELTVGARFYTNEPEPACVRDFLPGDISEVLLFDRLLSPAQTEQVRTYLARKHAGLTSALSSMGPNDRPRTVANPPAVQMLLPGFTVRQLPVDLPNINNVRYRADGKLVALGYNGNVYLLSDSDGDGLEDKVDLFWENRGQLRGPIGMALTPPGYPLGQGVFVASKGKLSLLLEGKGEGKVGREIVVARGWKELPHGVDALGVAFKDGKVYFGLGTADFTNAYQVEGGKGRYDIKNERGTILEVAPDFKTRKIVATGIRFSVGLAFNRRGDLFATDQEGATWLPNGNPFDELLHVQQGRHYGFPPRHPRHLPGVIDEPSVFDYGPQHQSTCGLQFNESVNGGPIFGPREWTGDALITGYSRGKLYRTQLVHTQAGYVARNHLLACLDMLAVDACVSPQGDLVVAVHSGAPDWGSGPGGKGKLYKISFTGKTQPQPVAVWAAGAQEVRVAFDRELDPANLRNLASRVVLEHGPYVRAGDRYEVLRPGYAVVQMQQAAPRRRIAVHSVRLIDGHTLSLSISAQTLQGYHALTLPALGKVEKPGKGHLRQHAEVDLDYELCGVETGWQPKDEKGSSWQGWLPHLDPAVSRAFLAGSAAHNALWKELSAAGKLTLKSKLDLHQMLRPAVQPGSTLDYTWPAEKVGLAITASAPFTAALGAQPAKASTLTRGEHVLRLQHAGKEDEPVPLEVVLEKDAGEIALQIAFFTNEDERLRALPLRRFLLPWAQIKAMPPVARTIPELEGGNWLAGQRIFFSDEAACGKCHAIRCQGGKIGPDLSNLVHRDYASVLKDVREPSAALNPDHVAYTFELSDGRVLAGVPRDGPDGKLIIGDIRGEEIVLARNKIESMTPWRMSLMPEGIDRVLGPAKMRDLMTFLLTEPLAPAPIERDGAPPPRKSSEVAKAWKSVQLPKKAGRRLRILLAVGPKDHGPGEHDYPLWRRRWYNLLSLAENVRVDTVNGWPKEAHWRDSDVIVFYSNNPGWTPERAKELEAFLARGGGAVYLHYAVDGHRAPEALAERIGLAWKAGASRFRHGPLEVTFPDAKSPITAGLDKLKFEDESYWRLAGDVARIDVVASGVEEGKAQPLLWTRRHGKGRVFVSIPGHYNWTFDDPLFRLLLLRGMCWTAGEPVDRLSELITVGARIEP